MTKSCFLCGKKFGFWSDIFGKYTISQEELSIPKGFGDEDVICFDCLQAAKVNLEKPEPEPRKKESKATQRQDDTQFWACPNCGRDTQMKDGRQYCPSCKFYLSI